MAKGASARHAGPTTRYRVTSSACARHATPSSATSHTPMCSHPRAERARHRFGWDRSRTTSRSPPLRPGHRRRRALTARSCSPCHRGACGRALCRRPRQHRLHRRHQALRRHLRQRQAVRRRLRQRHYRLRGRLRQRQYRPRPSCASADFRLRYIKYAAATVPTDIGGSSGVPEIIARSGNAAHSNGLATLRPKAGVQTSTSAWMRGEKHSEHRAPTTSASAST
jgi:hypothetical protein